MAASVPQRNIPTATASIRNGLHPAIVLAGSVPLRVNACVTRKLAFARDMAIL
jgi:hypothetical protein